jgi:hypothetical protein
MPPTTAPPYGKQLPNSLPSPTTSRPERTNVSGTVVLFVLPVAPARARSIRLGSEATRTGRRSCGRTAAMACTRRWIVARSPVSTGLWRTWGSRQSRSGRCCTTASCGPPRRPCRATTSLPTMSPRADHSELVMGRTATLSPGHLHPAALSHSPPLEVRRAGSRSQAGREAAHRRSDEPRRPQHSGRLVRSRVCRSNS